MFVLLRKIQNGRHFLKDKKILKMGESICYLDALGVENFDEIALSRTVEEIQAILCFCRKFKMAAIFQKTKCF